MHSSLTILLLSLLPSLISALPASSSCDGSTTNIGTLDTRFTLEALVPPTDETWGVFLPQSDDPFSINSPFISNDATLKLPIFNLTDGRLTTVSVDGTPLHASSPTASSSKTPPLIVIVFNKAPEQLLRFTAVQSCDSNGQKYLELIPLPLLGAPARQFVVKSVKEGQTIFEKQSNLDDPSQPTTLIELKINSVNPLDPGF